MAAYSFKSVVASILGPGGSINIGNDAGSAEEGISAAMDGEKGTVTEGSDGEIMHSLHAGNVGRITIRLLKTSPANALLSAMYNFQRSSPALWGVNTLVISDVARGDLVNGTEMAFVKQPDMTWAKVGNTVEWEFRGKLIEGLGAGIPDVNV